MEGISKQSVFPSFSIATSAPSDQVISKQEDAPSLLIRRVPVRFPIMQSKDDFP